MHQHGGDIYNHKNVLDFSTNINLLGTPEAVIQAACEGVKFSQGYPDINCSNLTEAISMAEEVPMDYIICGNGAADLIFSLVLGKKPKKALIPVPSFYEYEQALSSVDCSLVCYELVEEKGFCLQVDFLDEITEELDIIFLCNPNNPTGALIEPNLLMEILKLCEQYNILLVVDECFMDFVDEKEMYSMKESCMNSKNLFILKAFTKLYAMPGLRLGYGISGNLELIKRMKEVSQPWSVSTPAQFAGIAALKEKEYVKISLDLIKKEKAYLVDELTKMNFKIYASKANYIFFQGKPGLYRECLNKGILIRDCSNYRGLREGYYRIVVNTHEENKRLVEVLKEVIEWQNLL